VPKDSRLLLDKRMILRDRSHPEIAFQKQLVLEQSGDRLLMRSPPTATISDRASNEGCRRKDQRLADRVSAPVVDRASDAMWCAMLQMAAVAYAIGLSAYPGATLFKDTDNDSAADLGLTLGDFHFSLLAVNYVTSDSPAQVLAFYRKPLSRYGEVLECDHGKPVGALTVTRSGLTCGHESISDNTNSSTDHELRAGSIHQYRIVGIDESHRGSTRFGLVYLDQPKDSGEKPK
jgi:hypothetical protein